MAIEEEEEEEEGWTELTGPFDWFARSDLTGLFDWVPAVNRCITVCRESPVWSEMRGPEIEEIGSVSVDREC